MDAFHKLPTDEKYKLFEDLVRSGAENLKQAGYPYVVEFIKEVKPLQVWFRVIIKEKKFLKNEPLCKIVYEFPNPATNPTEQDYTFLETHFAISAYGDDERKKAIFEAYKPFREDIRRWAAIRVGIADLIAR